jgi:hypothetical protein
MGLFTKRRPAVAAWQPEDEAEAEVYPAAEVEDQGCAGPASYGVRFYSTDAPDAVITIWAYACHSGHGGYDVGYCCEFRAGDWTYRQYDAFDQLYDDLDDADAAARSNAALLAYPGPCPARPRTIPSEMRESAAELFDLMADWFDWDGEPF